MTPKTHFDGLFSPDRRAFSTHTGPPSSTFRTRGRLSRPLQQEEFTVAAPRRGQQPAASGLDEAEFGSWDAACGFATTVSRRVAKRISAGGRGSQLQRQLFAVATGTGGMQSAPDKAGDASSVTEVGPALLPAMPRTTRAAVGAIAPPRGQPLHAAPLHAAPLHAATVARNNSAGAAGNAAMRSGTSQARGRDESVATVAAAPPTDCAGATGTPAPAAAVSCGCLSRCAAGAVTGSVFRARRGSQPGSGGPTDLRASQREVWVAWWRPEPAAASSSSTGGACVTMQCQPGGLLCGLPASRRPRAAVDRALIAAASMDAARAVPRPPVRSREVRRRRWAAAQRLQAVWRQTLLRRRAAEGRLLRAELAAAEESVAAAQRTAQVATAAAVAACRLLA